MQLAYLQIVALALDGTLGGEHAHVARLRQAADHLRRRPDHAQHASLRVDLRQVYLLDGAQRLRRSRVTAEYHEVAAHLKELHHRLARKLIHHVE